MESFRHISINRPQQQAFFVPVITSCIVRHNGSAFSGISQINYAVFFNNSFYYINEPLFYNLPPDYFYFTL